MFSYNTADIVKKESVLSFSRLNYSYSFFFKYCVLLKFILLTLKLAYTYYFMSQLKRSIQLVLKFPSVIKYESSYKSDLNNGVAFHCKMTAWAESSWKGRYISSSRNIMFRKCFHHPATISSTMNRVESLCSAKDKKLL